MNIRIKCNKKVYHLTSDSRQFILSVVGKNKRGEEAYYEPQYFPTLPQVLEHLYQSNLRDNHVDNFRELVKHSNIIKDEILDLAGILSSKQITFKG